MLTEFVILPYNIATDVRKQLFNEDGTFRTMLYVEFTIDIIFVLKQVLTFCTAYRGDFGWIESFVAISLNYIGSPVFFFDIMSTYPTLITWYAKDLYWLYFFKIVRLYNLWQVSYIVAWFVQKLP